MQSLSIPDGDQQTFDGMPAHTRLLLRQGEAQFSAVSMAEVRARVDAMPQTLQEHAMRIASLRRVNAWLKRQRERALAEFNRSQESLLAAMERNEQALDTAEQAAREMALAQFQETGEKTLGYGFGVRVKREVEYDPEATRTWVAEHMPALLVLDTKRFERAVLNGVAECPLADILESPQATIAADLDKYLAE